MYYLLDHPNPNGSHYRSTRASAIRGIVIHTAENVADTVGPDGGAETVAHYGATATRSVSWHSTVDKDSIIPMLPDAFTAYHVIGYNSSTLGIEQACQSAKWDEYPSDWVDAIISNTAKVVGDWCKKYNIPAKRITKAEFDAGGRGVLAHADLDPVRRSDPGKSYPWGLLWEKIGGDSMLTEEQETFLAAFADSSLGLDPPAGGTSFPYLLRFYRDLALRYGVPGNRPEEIAGRLVAELGGGDEVARAAADAAMQALSRVKSVLP